MEKKRQEKELVVWILYRSIGFIFINITYTIHTEKSTLRTSYILEKYCVSLNGK